MKTNRFLSALLIIVLLIGTFAINVTAEDNIKVFLNGRELSFDVPPQLINDRTMVPMRKIFESLGAEVDWEGETQTVTATKADKKIVMQIDNTDILVSGQKIVLSVPPQLVNSRTLVPVRAVAEGLDADVEWYNNANSVIITTKKTQESSVVFDPSNVTVSKKNIGTLEWATQADKKILTGISSDVIYSFGNNWYYATSNGVRDTYIEGIFALLFAEYVDMFGLEVMSYKPIVIYNDANSPYPQTAPLDNFLLLRLSQDDTDYWAQMIFQMSHEIAHYAFFSFRTDANQDNFDDIAFSEWNEEIICEAFSLLMLDYAVANWDKCTLSKINPTFNNAVMEYLTDEYNSGEAKIMKREGNAVSSQEFLSMSDNADNNRDNHVAERNYLYDYLKTADPELRAQILYIYLYYDETYKYIKYSEWSEDVSSSEFKMFINKVSAIQPSIIKYTIF